MMLPGARVLLSDIRDDWHWLSTRWSPARVGSAGSASPVHWLLVSDRHCYTSEEQFHPIRKHAATLLQRFGHTFRYCRLDRALRLSARTVRQFPVIGVKLAWHTSESTALRVVKHFANASPDSKLVYFDGDDDLCIGFPAVLAHVDVYLKKHFFSRPEDACVPRLGKSNLTDFVARTYGLSTATQAITESHGVSSEALDRIAVGWNIALDGWYDRPAVPPFTDPTNDRPVDIWCRATASRHDWIYPLRNTPAQLLSGLATQRRILLPSTTRIPQDQYYRDLQASKLCISPFGYGELCWRDFEAIRCGCVLIKPDMTHLQTRPNLFVPFETYVPVKWDWSDLESVCESLLEQPELRIRIASHATERLRHSLTPDWFCNVFAELLGRLGMHTRTLDEAMTS